MEPFLGVFLEHSWVYYALIAALGYALVEFIDEHLLEDVTPGHQEWNGVGTLTLVSGFFGVVISGVFGVGILLSGNTIAMGITGYDYATQAMIAGALETVWMIPYLYALDRGGAINAGPLFQIIPVFTFLLGFFFFGEVPVQEHIIGSAIIIIGALMLNLNKGTLKLDKITVGLMFLASLIISIVYLLFKETVMEGSFVLSVFWSGIGMTIMSALIWVYYKPYRLQFNSFIQSSNRLSMLKQFMNEGLNAVSVIASHLANAKAPSVMVATAFNAFHPLFTLMIGWVLGKQGSEKHASTLEGNEMYKKIVAVIFITMGTVLVVM